MTNQELELLFNATILSDCSPLETRFLLEHPELCLYLFLWFVRGVDAENQRFQGVIEGVLSGYDTRVSVGSGYQKPQ